MNDKKAPPAATEKTPAQSIVASFRQVALDRARLLVLLRELRMGLMGAHSRERMLAMIEEEMLRQ